MSQADNQLKSHQRVFRVNMLVGFLIAAVATFLIITGTYDSIQTRQASETLLGWIAIAGMLYSIGFWFACLFRQQLFLKTNKQL